MGVFYTIDGMRYLAENATTPVALTVFDAVATEGSANITSVSSSQGLEVGMLIASPVLPEGTYILDMDGSSGEITLSQPASASTPDSETSVFVAGGYYTQNLPLTIHLGTGLVPTGPNVTMAQITEATYDGYVPQQAQGPVIVNTPSPRDYACFQYERQEWAPSDYTVANYITYHFWTYTPPGASGPTVLAVEPYTTSVDLIQDGDILTFNPTLPLAFDNTAGPASPGIA